MSTVYLDSFQLIVAVYLLYVAIKGNGQLYRFFDLSDRYRAFVRRPLRITYAFCGLISLADFGVSSLQSRMYTQSFVGEKVVITQNFKIDSLPFLTYDLLSLLSSVLTALLVVILIGIVVWLRALSKRDSY